MLATLANFLFLLLGGIRVYATVLSNFKATFGTTPSPFKIDVDPVFIAETSLKASLTRFALEIDVPS